MSCHLCDVLCSVKSHTKQGALAMSKSLDKGADDAKSTTSGINEPEGVASDVEAGVPGVSVDPAGQVCVFVWHIVCCLVLSVI
jgi:hypothetical protein